MINSNECGGKIEKKSIRMARVYYHFECEVEQFQWNEICDMLIDI